MNKKPSFVFFGSSSFSTYVLDALKSRGLEPIFSITSSREPLPIEKLKEINTDVFIVASFGKILPKEVIDMPKYKTLNVHPSLLPRLRGPAPIQEAIIGEKETGVTIIQLDEQMDHGPIVVEKKVSFDNWPVSYTRAEEKLGTEGGLLLADVLEPWVNGKIQAVSQDESLATYTKLIKKQDADITNDAPEIAYRKVLAYEVWPRARMGDLIITAAHLADNVLVIDRVIPPGKKEMNYQDYLRGRLV